MEQRRPWNAQFDLPSKETLEIISNIEVRSNAISRTMFPHFQ
jgi:hypothetical protein